MQRFRLTIAYDGRPFVGWQRQDNGPSVQQALEEAGAAFAGGPVVIHAAGRTDAGVHAAGQVAHVDIAKALTPYQVQCAFNHHLKPHPVSVLAAAAVGADFHARFSAIRRVYRYRIINRRGPLTVERGLAWHVPRPLDEAAMAEAARCLEGRHDFTTFRHVQCQAKSPIRTLDLLHVERLGEDLHIHAIARSFLHHQVRSMVGTLTLVGLGRWTPADVAAALAARDRKALGHNAPPDGLTLMRVEYGDPQDAGPN